jgi:hypothetical protein
MSRGFTASLRDNFFSRNWHSAGLRADLFYLIEPKSDNKCWKIQAEIHFAALVKKKFSLR